MTVAAGFGAENLLQPLNRDQQRVIEVVAQAFEENSWQWPVFDYLEGVLENEGVDAWTALASLPRHPESSYAAAWWSWRGGAKPQPNESVGLTVLGLHRAEELQSVTPGVVPAFFALVKLLAEWRKRRPLSATEPRNLRISSDLVITALAQRDVAENFLSPMLLRGLLEHEPATWQGGGSSLPDGTWERDVSRDVYRFEGLETIESYVGETIAMFWQPEAPEQVAAPSPLGLVSAIDYLDTVWRLVPGHTDHLFRLHGAQQVALLAFPANTADEFDSRLSGLGDLLRSIQLPAQASPTRRERGRPLAPLEAHLKSLLPASRTRIERAIETLQHVIDVRDAGQHSAAGKKGAAAMAELGIGYPPPSWSFAWTVVTTRTIEALEAIREELATVT
jgi:hypothetical protein